MAAFFLADKLALNGRGMVVDLRVKGFPAGLGMRDAHNRCSFFGPVILIATLAFISAGCGSCVPASVAERVVPRLHAATSQNNLWAMRQALADGEDIDEEWMLNTPLTMAADMGNIEAVIFLLDNGATIDKRVGLPGRTALHNAALKGRLEVIKVLLDRGAPINQVNKNGRTALYYAESPPAPLDPPPNAAEVARYLRSRGATK